MFFPGDLSEGRQCLPLVMLSLLHLVEFRQDLCQVVLEACNLGMLGTERLLLHFQTLSKERFCLTCLALFSKALWRARGSHPGARIP